MKIFKRQTDQRAFSTLELVITLTMIATVCTIVTGLLNHIQTQTQAIEQRMSRLADIQFSLDKLMDDIIGAAQTGDKISVDNDVSGRFATARLTIQSNARGADSRPLNQVDWVAAPRYDADGLILYRRVREGNSDKALYMPMCENIFSFKLELYDNGDRPHTDPNYAPTLIDLEVRLFRTDPPDPQQLITVARTFCLKRFQLPQTEASPGSDKQNDKTGQQAIQQTDRQNRQTAGGTRGSAQQKPVQQKPALRSSGDRRIRNKINMPLKKQVSDPVRGRRIQRR